MVPYVALPPWISFTYQVTVLSELPVTVAVNCCWPETVTEAVAGSTETPADVPGVATGSSSSWQDATDYERTRHNCAVTMRFLLKSLVPPEVVVTRIFHDPAGDSRRPGRLFHTGSGAPYAAFLPPVPRSSRLRTFPASSSRVKGLGRNSVPDPGRISRIAGLSV